MTDPMPLDIETLSARMKAVQDYVADCQRRVSLGEIMDLTGLDKNIMTLCEALASIPQNEALVFESRMKHLIDSLEELANLMRDQHKKFGS